MLVLTHRFEQQAELRQCLEMMGEGNISPHQIAAAFNQGSTIQGCRLFPEMFPLDCDILRIHAVTSNSLGAQQRQRDEQSQIAGECRGFFRWIRTYRASALSQTTLWAGAVPD